MVADNIMGLFHVFAPLRAFVLTALPKTTQGVFAALGDFYTWKLAETIYGEDSNAALAAVWLRPPHCLDPITDAMAM